MQDAQIGLILRQLRRHDARRQTDTAAAVRIGRATVSRVERGQLDGLTIASIRRVCTTVGATMGLTFKWRGPLLDRLMDEAHAGLCARVVEILERAGEVDPERRSPFAD